jgi:hypothetical protein
MVAAALGWMPKLGILEPAGNGAYRVAPRRVHPSFPLVADIVAYNARFLEQTLANAAYSKTTVVE